MAASAPRARLLARAVEGPGVRVLGTARTPDAAVELVAGGGSDARADVVLVDLAAAPAAGLAAIETIMARVPVPVVAAATDGPEGARARAAGAVDVVGTDLLPSGDLPQPPAGNPQHLSRPAGRWRPGQGGDALGVRLAAAARMPVITHPRARLRAEPAAAVVERPEPALRPSVRLVVLGASTGGPPALATILAGLPADLEVPVLVVQHMAEGFVDGLAGWLSTVGPLPVAVARDGDLLRPGRVLLAPAGCNTVVGPGLRVRLEPPRAGQFHVPGVDVALASAAAVCGPRAVGVLLTGMGRDGAEGMAALRATGATTLAQDEATCVVWGMPAAAVALGAVDRQVPLPGLAGALLAAVRGGTASAAPAAPRGTG
ncbi:MAG TPA: CheB methylesterase domain-containing protein [Motilibacteraceae bacterium]|nr:CheB methylesterase domain-containing protein [Motilibacteraceae bacterium]